MFGNQSEPVTLTRDCKAVIIPAGEEARLQAGQLVFITQSLGGSFTVYVDGWLYRIAGADADALGKKPAEPPKLPDNAGDSDVEALVWEQMKTCYDPEIPVNIVDLGLVYSCQLKTCKNGNRNVSVEMTLTAPGCGMGEILVEDVREKITLIPTISDVAVELVFDPPWNQSMMSEAAQLQAGLM
ncbi:MAG: putative Fe-S cluster assembly protein SufT [Gammaproteobacteria bacterium]|nr:putative Fe-S cluster assembly protein SufT [Gammaproteobacteria bacterium]MCY4164921.1 putative Fe-S cluster assembly protein SufT [Gammaproteobacteria bacterium]MCY4255372.1 putative Fe-S cluster assembly protein SufT [Gammaproteobacteria bacterium]MCY4340548.1 putative Fe-S cluster assembly protein SufT [Gammaproteobacteria bacterium]